MDRGRRRIGVEQRMQLVVQGARAFHDSDVLGDAWEAVSVARVVETLRELGRELGHIRPENCHEPAAEQSSQHLLEVIFRHWRYAGRSLIAFLPLDVVIRLPAAGRE